MGGDDTRHRDVAGLAATALGPAIEVSRGDLPWRISVPEDGSLPLDVALPTLIEWPGGSPASAMADSGCDLRSLTVEHPDAETVWAALDGRLHDARVRIGIGRQVALRAEINTPHGVRLLT